MAPHTSWVLMPARAAARYWSPAMTRIRKKDRYFFMCPPPQMPKRRYRSATDSSVDRFSPAMARIWAVSPSRSS